MKVTRKKKKTDSNIEPLNRNPSDINPYVPL